MIKNEHYSNTGKGYNNNPVTATIKFRSKLDFMQSTVSSKVKYLRKLSNENYEPYIHILPPKCIISRKREHSNSRQMMSHLYLSAKNNFGKCLRHYCIKQLTFYACAFDEYNNSINERCLINTRYIILMSRLAESQM